MYQSDTANLALNIIERDCNYQILVTLFLYYLLATRVCKEETVEARCLLCKHPGSKVIPIHK